MNNQVELTIKHIKSLSPVAIATDKTIGEHVINKFTAMYQVPKQQAVAYWEREKDNFMKRISDSEDLKACTPMSIFMSLMQGFGWGLSFEGGEQMDIYLIPGNRNVAPKNQPDQWIKECVAQPSPYGKKKIRIQNGQIKSTSDPKVVFDNDIYEEYTDDKENVRVKYVKNGLGPRLETTKIIGSFIKIDKPDGSFEIKTFDLEDVKSWKASSEKKNKGKTNHLYTANNGQIDKLFLEGKTLTHAFKGYPKVISTPKMPDTFVPDEHAAIRQGLDTSEFTEETTYSEVAEQKGNHETDEFTEALQEEKSEVIQTVVIAGDDDEPNFD
jgi:hypothetical protein